MSRPAIEAFALRAVGEAVRGYADNMTVDPYGDTRRFERDSHLHEHLQDLARHLETTAQEVAHEAKISHILERG